MIRMWDVLFSASDSDILHSLSTGNAGEAFESMHLKLDKVWRLIHTKTIDGGILCINVGDATRNVGGRFRLFSNHSRVIRGCLTAGFDQMPEIIWRKQSNKPNKFMGSGMLPPGGYVTHEHEFILIFRKGGKRKFEHQDEKIRRKWSAYFWEERNRWFSDTWDDIRGEKQERGRSTGRRTAAFPVQLPYRLISMFSVIGDMVLDPFCGTGNTCVAAVAACRNSKGIDIDEEYAALSRAALAGCLDDCRNIIARRLAGHRRFILNSGAENHLLLNKNYNFRVKTAQETEILLPVPVSIRSAEGQFRVVYSLEPFLI
jgi:DNA modification methylase